MSDGITMEFKVHLGHGRSGSRVIKRGPKPPDAPAGPGSVPRIAKLMALAIRFEELVRTGEVRDFAEIAELGHVTRARVSQIVNLLNLAPDIQEAILETVNPPQSLPKWTEKSIRTLAAIPDWSLQRACWTKG
jgi:hypothetical protein